MKKLFSQHTVEHWLSNLEWQKGLDQISKQV